MLMGLKPGELVMFTAGSGIGKSTLVHELGYHLLMEHKQSIGVLALEENVTRASERYLSIHLNRPLHLSREGVTEEALRKAFEATVGTERFYLYNHFGSTDLDNLLSKVRYMVVGLGVKWIILDHISIVVSGLDELEESERKMIDKLMTKLRSLVEETGCGLLAVVHLKRPQMGKSYNEGRRVSLTDLRGSASIEQLSDTVIALERDQQSSEDSNVSTVRVLKNRRVGKCGEADELVYNETTGRLRATEQDPFAVGPIKDDGKGDF
jgi:twinkle protein